MAEIREDRTRFKANERTHVLDEATRNRRQRRALEALEKDNFQELPSANDSRQQQNKKLQQKFSIESDTSANTGEGGTSGGVNLNENLAKKRKLRPESKLKYRKNFNMLIEEEQALITEKKLNYFSISVPASIFPSRKFCAVCGFLSVYNCVQCGAQYCGLKCLQTHQDTRCLKWTA